MSGRGALALAVALCSLPAPGAAQRAGIQGFVTSATTRAPLEGVVVTLEREGQEAYRAATDRNGFYQLGGIVAGEYTLFGRLVGQRRHEQPVTLAPGARITASFRLEPDPVVLEGIRVEATRPSAAVRELGRQLVTPAHIRMVPAPAGTGDLATYLQTLPGVTTTGDRGGQVFVRGGTPAENLALVDGIPIYQPFHILGFFSVFPEDLVSSVDFYAGGFGARYADRASSVLDVHLRDGNPTAHRAMASASPFLAEALVEGPVGMGMSVLASMRRSLVEETSGTLLGTTQPLTFESQLIKLAPTHSTGERCSVLFLRTADRGGLDPHEAQSRVGWRNLLGGLRCVTQFTRLPRLLEVSFSYSSSRSDAVSRGSSQFRSKVWRVHHDLHTTSLLGSLPVYAGYQTYLEGMSYDLAELMGVQSTDLEGIFGVSGYVEAAVPVTRRAEVRPGVVLTASPRPSVQPRIRASVEPFGRPSEKVQGAFGLYRQDAVGTSDMRDVGSVFVAWMSAPDDVPLDALHATLGWQQSVGRVRWSLEGYYKQLSNVPVPVWRGVARFSTELGRADGTVYGADTRLEYVSPRFHGFVGYGYSWTQYEAAQAEFGSWFGQPVQRYHPPHDRRHQLNAVGNLDVAGFRVAARWQLGSGLPFTQPLGFDEGFDFTKNLHDVHLGPGTTRQLLDRPFTGRLPTVHRLDVSVERDFDLALGQLQLQAGVINAYDRRNMFYYDLFTGRRADQLPLAPYASVTLRPH